MPVSRRFSHHTSRPLGDVLAFFDATTRSQDNTTSNPPPSAAPSTAAMSGLVRKYDVCVPVRRTAEFLKAAEDLFLKRHPMSRLYLFGHFGDGSPHLNFLKPSEMPAEAFHQEVDAYESELYPLLKSFSGSVSAEHGIGCLKRSWVTFSRTPAELRLLKAIKTAFDPQGLLNPGKIYV